MRRKSLLVNRVLGTVTKRIVMLATVTAMLGGVLGVCTGCGKDNKEEKSFIDRMYTADELSGTGSSKSNNDDASNITTKESEDYKTISKAITEMYKQVGPPQLDESGIIKRGLIIRHLILPNEIENSKNVLKWIVDNIGKEVYVSIMAQYFPTYKAKQIKELNRKINNEEYKQIEDYIYEIGIENGYMQDLGEHEEEYVPDFKNSLT